MYMQDENEYEKTKNLLVKHMEHLWRSRAIIKEQNLINTAECNRGRELFF